MNLGLETRGTFFPFLIHDFTAREQRAYPQGKPTDPAFGGVARVVVAVRNLVAAEALYRKAFGLPPAIQEVDREFGARLAGFGRAPVVLAEGLTNDNWIANRIARFGEGPCAFILFTGKGAPPQASSKTRWFGRNISWADASRLGWRLGFEAR